MDESEFLPPVLTGLVVLVAAAGGEPELSLLRLLLDFHDDHDHEDVRRGGSPPAGILAGDMGRR